VSEEREVGSGSLEAAARFAIAVLDAQVLSQGKAWNPKLAYTAAKYLTANLPEARNAESPRNGGLSDRAAS
jgi:hypothetical protein